MQTSSISSSSSAMRPSDGVRKDKEPITLDLRTPEHDKPPAPKGSKLKTVLAGMKVERTARSPTPGEVRDPPTEIPRKAEHPSEARKKPARTEEKLPKVDPQLVDAVERLSLAMAPKLDPATVKSELLAKLLDHADKTDRIKKSTVDLSHLIAGMKIDRSKPPAEAGTKVEFQTFEDGVRMAQEPVRAMLDSAMSDSAAPKADRDQPRRQTAPLERVDIFGAPPLGIFKDVEALRAKPQFRLKTWERLEKEALQSLTNRPPKNAFQEMANWTKEGKLWHFPIDNEQGVLDHEKDVDFSEHVFLEHLIADFPRKGPIRQFMDIVIYALSKNPFLTVQEKEAHVDWYREYFIKKQSIIVDVMGEEMGLIGRNSSSPTESQDSEASPENVGNESAKSKNVQQPV